MGRESLLFALFVITCCLATEDKELLKNALSLIYRRQAEVEPDIYRVHSSINDDRYHPDFSDFESDSPSSDSEELTVPYEEFYPSTKFDSNKIYIDYDSDSFPGNEISYDPSEKKVVRRKPSAFRERIDHQYNSENKPIAELFSPNYESSSDDDFQNEINYEQLLQAYWNKYRANKQADRFENVEPNYITHKRKKTIPMYSYPNTILIKKRFPVTKRSSNYYGFKSITHKRAPKSNDDLFLVKSNRTSQTDPKVAEDLTQIFGGEYKNDKKKTPKKANSNLKKPITKSKTLEKVIPTGSDHEEKLQIKKKSIDWSSYFGIDRRRKKSGNSVYNPGEINDQWLMEQYKSALQRFEAEDSKENLKRKDEPKLEHMRTKLKNIEDMIIDEALKYTGAHEGEVDTKEVQEVKDKVMAHLTTAYNLEKMRHALDEYKKSLNEHRNFNKYGEDMFPGNGEDSIENFDEIETNTSTGENSEANQVPEKKNSNILHHDPKDDSSKDPCNLLDLIDRQCRNIARKSEEEIIHPLCTLHQLCSICGADELMENEVVRTTNEKKNVADCNYMFMAESERVCALNLECRHNMNYGLNLLRGLRTPLSPEFCQQNGECVNKAVAMAKHYIIHEEYNTKRKRIM